MKVVNVTTGEEIQPKIIECTPYDCLHEKILGLSEDIIDHEEVLQMLWEKIQAVEDDQVQDAENLSDVVDILECLQEVNKLMIDSIIKQDEQIKEFKSKHNSLARLMCAVLIWMAVLTVLFWVYVF